MQPQGTAPLNTAWIDNLTADIQSVNGCAALQALVNTGMATLQAEVNAIETQIAALLPVITIPAANPAAIVAWITQFVQPLIVAYETYAAQLSQLLAAVARLETAIQNAATSFTHCSITVPFVGPVQVTG